MPDILRLKILASALFFFLPLMCSPQSFKAFEKAGDGAFSERDFYAAMYYYADALELKPEHPGVGYKYAEVARHFNAFAVAEQYYSKVLASAGAVKFPLANYWLGMVKKNQGDYDEAKSFFVAFLGQAGNPGKGFKQKAQQELGNCARAKEIIAHPDPVNITHLNKRINTAYSEFGALQRGDTLYYSSFRFDNKLDKNKPPRKITKVLTSLRNAKGRPMRRNFNQDNIHTAHTAFSLDGRRIYFTRCQYLNSTQIRCALFYREKDKRNRWKSSVVKLPPEVNRPGFTTTQPSIAFDSMLNTELLYFASDRPRGKGGMDIWYTTVQKGSNKFSRPFLPTEVNTPEDDFTPFFHTASQTLYFSSNGHPGLGGYDIFKIKRTKEWGGVEHMGYPINTSYNDVYFSLNRDDQTGLFSSNRPGSFYLDENNKVCCNDIYRFQIIERQEIDTTLFAVEPVVHPPDSLQETNLTSLPNKLEDFLPLALYFDNDEPDKRTQRTTSRKSYRDTFRKYFKRKAAYQQEFSKPLPEEDRAEAEQLMEQFFEREVKRGSDFLLRFSGILLERLEGGEKIEIFIKGFTSPRAQRDYNLALSKRRISSLKNHFERYRDGNFQPYLKSSQLVISERPFGETKAARDISDDLQDLRNSIYSLAAARERRVEIIEIKREK